MNKAMNMFFMKGYIAYQLCKTIGMKNMMKSTMNILMFKTFKRINRLHGN